MAEEEKDKKKKQRMPKGVIPTDKEYRIYQPYSLVIMQYDYSLIQQKVFAAMIKSLQEPIRQVLAGTKVEDVSFFKVEDNLFKDESGGKHIRLKIYPKTMNIERKHYPLLKESIIRMSQIIVKIPEKDNNGYNWEKGVQLITPHFPCEKKLDYFYVDILEKNAIKLVGDGKQYINYLFSTIISARQSYTPRLYIFISAWRGKTTRQKTISFRRMLCLMKDQNEDKKDKYPRFSELCRCVINKTQQELYEKAMKGETDCYFEYQPIYTSGKFTGEPDFIDFKVIVSDKGSQMDGAVMLNKKKMEAANVLLQQFKWEEGFIRELLSKVDGTNIDNLYQAINKTDERITSRKIENIAHYSYVFLCDEFNRLNKGEKEADQKPEMLELPFEEEKPKNTDIEMTDEEQIKWKLFHNALSIKISKEAYKTWMQPIIFVSYKENRLVVKVPTKFFWEFLEEKYVDVLREAIECSFGAGTQLMYNIEKI